MPHCTKQSHTKKGGQKIIRNTLSATGDLVNDLSKAILSTLSGIGLGLETVVESIGDVGQKFGKDVSVVSRHISKGLGGTTKTIADSLGKVVKKVPIIGKPTSYIVKGAGKGVYYVVMSIDEIIGKISTMAGKTVKTASNVIIFTLASGKKVSRHVIKASSNTIKSVLAKTRKIVNPKARKANKNRKANKTNKTRKVRKTRKARRSSKKSNKSRK